MAKNKKGLGDRVEQITKVTGIKTIVDGISELTGWDCGCDKRKKMLNELPQEISRFFKKKEPECLTEQEASILKDYLYKSPSVLTREYQENILLVYNRVFRKKQKPTSCSDCWTNIKSEIKQLIKGYDETN